MLLLNAFAPYPGLLVSIKVIRYEYGPNRYRLEARATLKDGSLLVIRDYLFPDKSRKYSYHWQDASGALIGRWDNQPHWFRVPTHPHHFHAVEGSAEASHVRSLEDALRLIAERLG